MLLYARPYLLFFLLLMAITGCQQKITTAPVSITHATPEQEISVEPVLIPKDYAHNTYNGLQYTDEVFRFYRSNNYKPFWLDNNVRSSRADSMIMMVRSARKYGLLPQQYHFHEIPELVLEPMNRVKMARLDVILTDALLSMAHDLKQGRMKVLKAKPQIDSLDVVNIVTAVETLGVKKALEHQEPLYEGYLALKRALRAILDTVSLIDQNLLMYGITNDSIDVHRKVQRIEINLERWRTENATLDKIYTWINVPAFMFYVMENHAIAMESRIVVGTPATPTPLFSSSIDCFTIYPYWYVPRKIAVQEYLPIIKKDTTFITRNNFDVLDRSGNVQPLSSIDWNTYNVNNFPFTLRQREGTENSLGVIKFQFDNPYAVFLHDTNSKRLFRNKIRAYSHGCIRLEKAFEFAHYLIGDNRTKISSEVLDRYLHQQKRIIINLSYPVPIHIRYFTSEVKGDELLIYDDIYKKDNALIRALYSQRLF
jgi:murein L,D-transpeptidase YcbB/YkuD